MDKKSGHPKAGNYRRSQYYKLDANAGFDAAFAIARVGVEIVRVAMFQQVAGAEVLHFS